MSEGGADEKRWYDFSSLQAASEGDGGEQHLQKKCIGGDGKRGVPDAGGDDVCAGSVVGLIPDKEREENDGGTAGDDTQVRIRQPPGHGMLGLVHDGAEKRAHRGTEGGEHQNDRGRSKIGGDCGRAECENGLTHAHNACDIVRCQGGNHAGHQSGIVHDADGADLHGQNGGGKRRAEKRRKGGAHAAHDDPPPLQRVETEQAADAIGNGAADLKSGPLTPCGSAEKMRQNGRYDDERSHAGRNMLPFPDGRNDTVGVPRAVGRGCLIQKDDEKTCHGQQENQPSVIEPIARCLDNGHGKKRSDDADDDTHQTAEENPLDPDDEGVDNMLQVCFVHNAPISPIALQMYAAGLQPEYYSTFSVPGCNHLPSKPAMDPAVIRIHFQVAVQTLAGDGSWRSCPIRGHSRSVLGPSGAKLAEYARKHRGLTRPLIRTFSATLSLSDRVNSNIFRKFPLGRRVWPDPAIVV